MEHIMDYLKGRIGEPSTYAGFALMFLIGGGIDFTDLLAIDWKQAVSLAASVLSVALRESR